MIHLEVNELRKVGILGKRRLPARFGKCAAEPEADRRQLIIWLAVIQRAVVDADHQRRTGGGIADCGDHHIFALYT